MYTYVYIYISALYIYIYVYVIERSSVQEWQFMLTDVGLAMIMVSHTGSTCPKIDLLLSLADFRVCHHCGNYEAVYIRTGVIMSDSVLQHSLPLERPMS